MSNIATLMNAGLIAAGTVFSSDDTATIEALSSTEVQALIDVYNNVGLSFLSRNCGSSAPAPGPGHPIGIVF